jgi:hypothetical protein
MRHRRYGGAPWLVALAFALGGCNLPTEPDGGGDTIINNTNTNTNNIGQGGTGGGGAGPGGATGPCIAAARVGVKLHGSEATRASEVTAGGPGATLDATPQDQADNPRPDNCNLLSSISWVVNPSGGGACTVRDGTSFTPNIIGTAAGECLINARLQDHVSGNTLVSNTYVLTVRRAPTFVERVTATAELADPPALLPEDFGQPRWEHTKEIPLRE